MPHGFNVCSFQDFESNEKFHIKDDRVSHLLPAFYQDMIVRVYSKKPDLVHANISFFPRFLLRKIEKSHYFFYHHSLIFDKIIQVGAVSEAFENFQLKTYGTKTQVHATPDKKKRPRYIQSSLVGGAYIFRNLSCTKSDNTNPHSLTIRCLKERRCTIFVLYIFVLGSVFNCKHASCVVDPTDALLIQNYRLMFFT